MKKLVVAVLAGLSACCLAFQAMAAYPEMTIRLSHNQPKDSPEDLGAQKFKEVVEKKSGGMVKVDVFPHMQLGSMREQTEMVQMGTLEASIQPVSVLTPFVEQIQIIDFPFLWPSKKVLYSVMDGEVGQKFYAFTESKNMKTLGLWASGFKQITTKVKPVKSPSDLKGMKIRVMPSPLLVAQYKSWGANPVPIEYGELYNALQQGIVDGQENPLQSIAMAKFYEVQDYMTLSNHGFLAYLFVVNNSWFKKLPADVKALLVDAEQEARTLERQKQSEFEDQYLAQIKKSKIIVSELTPENREAFVSLSKKLHSEFAKNQQMKDLLIITYKAIEAVK